MTKKAANLAKVRTTPPFRMCKGLTAAEKGEIAEAKAALANFDRNHVTRTQEAAIDVLMDAVDWDAHYKAATTEAERRHPLTEGHDWPMVSPLKAAKRRRR